MVIALVVGTLLGGCGTDDPAEGTVLVDEARSPAAMAPLPDGGLLYGERLTGRVRRVAADGEVEPDPVAEVEVSTDGQRGLLGLAVDRDRVFAAWTDSDRRLQVAQVYPGPVRPVWTLTRTADLANGGRLAIDAKGGLLLAVGDLQQPERVADLAAPNGKILALDPEGDPNQRPRVVSGGWNNPFAFTVTADGDVWIADNAPGDERERLARADPSGPVTELPATTAASGLAATTDGRLLVCGFVSGALLRYRIEGDRARFDDEVAGDCRLGVVVLSDDRVAYATEDSIVVLPVSEL